MIKLGVIGYGGRARYVTNLSALMCPKAEESAATETFQEIRWPEG